MSERKTIFIEKIAAVNKTRQKLRRILDACIGTYPFTLGGVHRRDSRFNYNLPGNIWIEFDRELFPLSYFLILCFCVLSGDKTSTREFSVENDTLHLLFSRRNTDRMLRLSIESLNNHHGERNFDTESNSCLYSHGRIRNALISACAILRAFSASTAPKIELIKCRKYNQFVNNLNASWSKIARTQCGPPRLFRKSGIIGVALPVIVFSRARSRSYNCRDEETQMLPGSVIALLAA